MSQENLATLEKRKPTMCLTSWMQCRNFLLDARFAALRSVPSSTARTSPGCARHECLDMFIKIGDGGRQRSDRRVVLYLHLVDVREDVVAHVCAETRDCTMGERAVGTKYTYCTVSTLLDLVYGTHGFSWVEGAHYSRK